MSNTRPSPSASASTLAKSSSPDPQDDAPGISYQKHFERDLAEMLHMHDVSRAYRQYATYAMHQLSTQFHIRLAKLPASQLAVLPDHLIAETAANRERAKLFQDASIRNQFCLDCILQHSGQPHSQQNTTDASAATEEQMSKVSSVLKSLAREWSVEGRNEREMCYRPLLESVQRYIPSNRAAKVSVPGAGLGRLALEIFAKGYTVQGNEFSVFMLLASDFILNGDCNGMEISPWLLETRNVKSMTDTLRTVQIPDVDPFALATEKSASSCNELDDKSADIVDEADHCNNESQPSDVSIASEFSMAAGDFTSIYKVEAHASCWDAVVASFFLDADFNIVETLQVIYHMLKPGGYLISFGPLHWHWSGPAMLVSDKTAAEYDKRYQHLDPRYLCSIDLTWDDVEQIMTNIGFEIVEIQHDLPALYTANCQSMLLTEYRCTHFVARKVVRDNSMPA